MAPSGKRRTPQMLRAGTQLASITTQPDVMLAPQRLNWDWSRNFELTLHVERSLAKCGGSADLLISSSNRKLTTLPVWDVQLRSGRRAAGFKWRCVLGKVVGVALCVAERLGCGQGGTRW